MTAATRALFGFHAVTARLRQRAESVETLYVDAARQDARMRDLVARAKAAGVAVHAVDAARLAALSGHATHQGVVAIADAQRPHVTIDDVLAPLGEPALLLVLDEVTDPHNLGACLRTADACGVLAVIVPKDRAAQLTPAARKVAAGAAETTPVVAVTNLVRALRLLKEAGLWVVGADAGAEKSADAVDLKGPAVLVLGAEGAGLRQLTRQNCDFLVRLPQLGAVESLNVSVAAGMLLYEAARQRGGWQRQE